jgi:hypothetical protein
MSDDTTLDTVTEHAEAEVPLEQSTAAKMIAPLATLVAAVIVRRALEGGYKAVRGTPPPRANDRNASLSHVLMWAAVTASAVAVASVIVDRLTAPHAPDA